VACQIQRVLRAQVKPSFAGEASVVVRDEGRSGDSGVTPELRQCSSKREKMPFSGLLIEAPGRHDGVPFRASRRQRAIFSICGSQSK